MDKIIKIYILVLIMFIISSSSLLYASPETVKNQARSAQVMILSEGERIYLENQLIEIAMSPRPPLRLKRSSDGRYIDNGNGTISDARSGLMWGKLDSYADLGKCLDWNSSTSYVKGFAAGGHSDWRLPTIAELKGIYEESKTNKDFSDNLIHLDSIFAIGGAFWYWTSEQDTKCCAYYVDFYGGFSYHDTRDYCSGGGVRPVRTGH
jgi:hypothetical protein